MPLVTQGTRTARKPHICAYCRSTIPLGSKHDVWVWADMGTAYRLRGHAECAGYHSRVPGWEEELMDPDYFRQVCEEDFEGPFPWSNP
jgi:hypothetical protein